ALRKGGQGFSRRVAKQQFELGGVEHLAALAEELAQHQVELLPEQLVLALKERDTVDKMLLPFRCHSDDTIYDECRIQGKPDHSRSYQGRMRAPFRSMPSASTAARPGSLRARALRCELFGSEHPQAPVRPHPVILVSPVP